MVVPQARWRGYTSRNLGERTPTDAQALYSTGNWVKRPYGCRKWRQRLLMHYENYPPGQRPRVDVGMKAQSTFRKIQRKIKEHCGIKAIRTRKKKAHPGEAVRRTTVNQGYAV